MGINQKRNTPKALLLVWALIIVVTGCHFRLRQENGLPSIDWLVIVQLAVCAAGIAIALPRLLVWRKRPTYTWLIALYVGAVAITLPWSPDPVASTGYFILLAGGFLTTVALLQRVEFPAELLRKETFLNGVLILCLLENVVIAFGLGGEAGSGRLGIGDDANGLSLLAVITFVMQLGRRRHPILRYTLQAFCLLVIVLAQSRGSAIALVIGMAAYLWKGIDEQSDRQMTLKLGASALVISVLLGSILLYSASSGWFRTVVDTLNRDRGLHSAESFTTGRTVVWTKALDILQKEPVTPLVFGNGYGLSRLVLNRDNQGNDVFFEHAHNTVLDFLISTGLVGTAALFVLIGVTLITVARLRCRSMHPVSTRAAAVICIVLATFPTESYLATKLSFMHITLVFYLCVVCVRRQDSDSLVCKYSKSVQPVTHSLALHS